MEKQAAKLVVVTATRLTFWCFNFMDRATSTNGPILQTLGLKMRPQSHACRYALRLKALIHVEAGPISTVPMYDDILEGAFDGPGGFNGFFDRFQSSAYQGIAEFVNKLEKTDHPVKCLVYDANLPLANVAKKLGLSGIAFFTQSCATMASYYSLYCQLMGNPLPENPVPGFSFSGLPYFGPSSLNLFRSQTDGIPL